MTCTGRRHQTSTFISMNHPETCAKSPDCPSPLRPHSDTHTSPFTQPCFMCTHLFVHTVGALMPMLTTTASSTSVTVPTRSPEGDRSVGPGVLRQLASLGDPVFVYGCNTRSHQGAPNRSADGLAPRARAPHALLVAPCRSRTPRRDARRASAHLPWARSGWCLLSTVGLAEASSSATDAS